MMELEQAPIQTDHVLHAGMYSRTITIPPSVPVVGSLTKIPTLLIFVGDGKIFVNGDWYDIKGYRIFTGFKGRKQAVFSLNPMIFTMIFPTSARTVDEAEREFTDEYELLLSRRQNYSTTVITEEQA